MQEDGKEGQDMVADVGAQKGRMGPGGGSGWQGGMGHSG